MGVLPTLPFTWDTDDHFRIHMLLSRALRTEIEAVVTTTKSSRPDPLDTSGVTGGQTGPTTVLIPDRLPVVSGNFLMTGHRQDGLQERLGLVVARGLAFGKDV